MLYTKIIRITLKHKLHFEFGSIKVEYNKSHKINVISVNYLSTCYQK